MKITKRFSKINPKMQSIIIISILIIIGIIIGFIIASSVNSYLIEKIEQNQNLEERINLSHIQKDYIMTGFSISLIILSIEICLLIGLIYIYINIYNKTKSKYLMGFILFVCIFLAKSVTQFLSMTPLFIESIRATPKVIIPLIGSNFGPFGIFFTIFEIIAICILLYISRE